MKGLPKFLKIIILLAGAYMAGMLPVGAFMAVDQFVGANWPSMYGYALFVPVLAASLFAGIFWFNFINKKMELTEDVRVNT